ncbi:MAG: hypothetical protein ACOYMB_03775 [Patescibacteria group bacterium]
MKLSLYHQKYADNPDEEINRRIDAKKQELIAIFREVSLNTVDSTVKVAVLGCGDKRFVSRHREMFEQLLEKNIEITTFDITVEHLGGEDNIIQHDCTLPLPGGPYDITYGHVVLKFIDNEKQFDLLQNSYLALKPGGIAIHIFDREEIESRDEKLIDGQWSVPLEKYKKMLSSADIKYQEIPVKYGIALVLIK